MPIAKTLPLAPPGARSVLIVSQCLDRLDAIMAFLRAVHGGDWAVKAASATGLKHTQLLGYYYGYEVPTLLRLAVLEAYAVEEGFVSTNAALAKVIRRRHKDHPELSEKRKRCFLERESDLGMAGNRLKQRLVESLK